MVGDAPADMEAGRRAGVQTCAVRYGYGDLRRWRGGSRIIGSTIHVTSALS